MDQIEDVKSRIKAETNRRNDEDNELNELVLKTISKINEKDYYSQNLCDLFKNLECLHDVKPNKVLLILLDTRFCKFCRLFINFFRNEFDLDEVKHQVFGYFLKSLTNYVREHDAFASKLTESGTIQAIDKLIKDKNRYQNEQFLQTLISCITLLTRISYHKESHKIFKELNIKKFLIDFLKSDYLEFIDKFQFYLFISNLLVKLPEQIQTEEIEKENELLKSLFDFYSEFLKTSCTYDYEKKELMYGNDELFTIKDIEMSLYALYSYSNDDWTIWKDRQSKEINEWLDKVMKTVNLTEKIDKTENKEEVTTKAEIKTDQETKINEFKKLIESNFTKQTCEHVLQKLKIDPSMSEDYYRILNENHKLEEMNIEFKNSLETKNSYKSYDKMIIYLQISRHLLDYSTKYQELINNNFEYLHPFMLILTKNDYLTKNQLVQNALVCFYKSCKNRNFKMEIMEAERMRLVEIFDMLDKHAKFDNIIFNLYFFMGFSLVCNHEEFSRVLHEKNCKEYVDYVFHVLSKLKIDKNNRFLHSFTLDARSPTIYSHEILNSLVKFVDIEYVKQRLMNNNFLNTLMKHYKQITNDIYGERELIMTLIMQLSSLISSNRSSININELNEILQSNLDNNFLVSLTRAILNNISNDADGTVETFVAFNINVFELTKFKNTYSNEKETRQIVSQIIDFLRFMQPLESETDEKLNLCRLCLEVLKSKKVYHKPIISVIREKDFFNRMQEFIKNYVILFNDDRKTDVITRFIVELFDLMLEFIEVSKEFQEVFIHTLFVKDLVMIFFFHDKILWTENHYIERTINCTIQIIYWLCENKDSCMQLKQFFPQIFSIFIQFYKILKNFKCLDAIVLIILYLIDENNFKEIEINLLKYLLDRLVYSIINCINDKTKNIEGKLTYIINYQTNSYCFLHTVLKLFDSLMFYNVIKKIACKMCDDLIIPLVELYTKSSNEDELLYSNKLLWTFSLYSLNNYYIKYKINSNGKFMYILQSNAKSSHDVHLKRSAGALMWTLSNENNSANAALYYNYDGTTEADLKISIEETVI